MTSALRSVLAVARHEGPLDALRFIRFRASENSGEKRWNIRSGGLRSARDLGYTHADCHEYGPAPYRVLRFALDRVPIRAGKSVFLDFGCGLGQAVVVASARPFREVIGVELSSELAQGARANLRSAGARVRCPARIVEADAAAFPIPPDVDVVFFNNPFFGETLRRVVGNVRESLRTHPRELTIVYGVPRAFEELVAGEPWIERVQDRTFYKDARICIYRCRAD